MWDKEAFCYDSHVMGKGYIAIFGMHVSSKIKCSVVNVYAECNLSSKVTLWKEISNIIVARQDVAWCIDGDFNAVRSVNERRGARVNGDKSKEITGFNDFIDRNCLMELPVVGKKYTWFKSNGFAKSRLDRVLVSEEWLHKWSMSKLYVQPREVSYHCAIIVKSYVKDWDSKPFRTIDVWLMERSLEDLVKDRWSTYVVQGNGVSKLKDKLKMVKADLKVWNYEVFGHLNTNKERMIKEIEDLDCQDVNGSLDDKGRSKRMQLCGRLSVTNKKIDSLMSQKARANWVKYGDSCSRYFHSMLRWRRLKNEVKGVEVGGQWSEEPKVVRKEAKKVFEGRFVATKDFGVQLGEVEFNSVSEEDNQNLIADISEGEIREAIWQCEGNKSPGPDGYNFNFIKKYWDVMKREIVDVVRHFQIIGISQKGVMRPLLP